MSPELPWSLQPPQKPGWYWVRTPDAAQRILHVVVRPGHRYLAVRAHDCQDFWPVSPPVRDFIMVAKLGALWAGPIPAPIATVPQPGPEIRALRPGPATPPDEPTPAGANAPADPSALQQRIAALERALAGFRASIERTRPLCPDHRDKVQGSACLACRLEAAEAEIQRLKTQTPATRAP